MALPGHSILIPIFTLVVTVMTSPPDTLRHVNMVFRHGDRSPHVMYPNDINKVDVWPDGLGWLSNIGKHQQYELGKYLRQRYGGFINVTRYHHEQISIQSSAVNRCIMSVLANLAGLFPPEGDQVWNDQLAWQPIPISSVPKKQDNKLALGVKCPRYDQLYDEIFASPIATDYERDNKAFFDLLSNNTGWDERSSLSNTWKLIDPVVCERAHNMSLNDFLQKPGVLEKLDEVQQFSWQLQYSKAESAKLMGGPLLKEFISNMETAIKGSDQIKLHMYSAHDSTVSALLNAMTVSNNMQPPYASIVMVELHKINNGDYIKIYFRNDSNSDADYLVPNGCEDPCKLSTFQSVVANRIPHNWEEECKVQPGHNSSPSRHLHPGLTLSLSFLAIAVKLVTFCLQ